MIREIPGLTYAGTHSDPDILGGAELPVYEMTGGINTLESWNEACRSGNRRAFVQTFGREPVDDAEVLAWVNRVVEGKESA